MNLQAIKISLRPLQLKGWVLFHVSNFIPVFTLFYGTQLNSRCVTVYNKICWDNLILILTPVFKMVTLLVQVRLKTRNHEIRNMEFLFILFAHSCSIITLSLLSVSSFSENIQSCPTNTLTGVRFAEHVSFKWNYSSNQPIW